MRACTVCGGTGLLEVMQVDADGRLRWVEVTCWGCDERGTEDE